MWPCDEVVVCGVRNTKRNSPFIYIYFVVVISRLLKHPTSTFVSTWEIERQGFPWSAYPRSWSHDHGSLEGGVAARGVFTQWVSRFNVLFMLQFIRIYGMANVWAIGFFLGSATFLLIWFEFWLEHTTNRDDMVSLRRRVNLTRELKTWWWWCYYVW